MLIRARVSCALLAVIAAGALVGCGGTNTVEDKVIAACVDAIKKTETTARPGLGVFAYASQQEALAPSNGIGSSFADRIEVHDIELADLTATAQDGSGPTKGYLVKGVGHATRTLRPVPGQYDEDGKPDALPDVTKRIECNVGYRDADQVVTVFDYRSPVMAEGFFATTLVTRPPSP